jgi:hypothetical protein
VTALTTIDEAFSQLRIKDVGRVICGVCTVFGQRAPNGVYWEADQFAEFLDLSTAIPLRVDHGPLINSRGVIANVGIVRYFAEIKYPMHGLLCLAEIDHAEGYGDALLADIAALTSQAWLPAGWGLSLGALYTSEIAMPYEISVTRSPAFEDCKVLGAGERAIESWILLTGQSVRTATRR